MGDMFYFIMQSTMFFMIPLVVVALGGLFSEKSGVVNIALNGKMIMGAFTGILFISTFQERLPGQPVLVLGLIIGMVTGIGVSLFHAFASIKLKANQVISGVAINMFAPAFAVYTSRRINGTQLIRFNNQFQIESVPVLGDIPVVGQIFFQNAYITTYLGFLILIISAFVLYKTKFGLRLRACGEHPHAADSVGVSVVKMRYAGVIISGALAGMGGVILIVPITNVFDGSVSGYGFLALAVLIFGAWKPLRILVAAFFFGLMSAVAASASVIEVLQVVDIPIHFYRMLPYVATLVVLAFTSKNTMAPRAAGQPYDKGGR
ncbi:MAG: ABC transporter permease [Defluviitaleaceae bacterium]|nr:ABC transporter permease [Defluviitaleaceae bacterium]